ncbi:hypothetical protein [Azotosporobacter soli]|uniref:hypothetical protein n=1 Tax=Azotosporobacter soli TaxID=3055040 RepID=UPI0031FE7977
MVVIWLMLVYIDALTAIIVAGVLGGVVYAVMRQVRQKIETQGMQQVLLNCFYT